MPGPSHKTHTGSQDLFDVVRPLGRGNADVWEVQQAGRPGQTYARKSIKLDPTVDRRKMEMIMSEIDIMKRLRHIHVIRFRGSYEWKLLSNYSIYNLLMSPVAKTDLENHLMKLDNMENGDRDRLLTSRMMRPWPACLFRALAYVHFMNIRHKDIKPANILIDNNNTVLLTDFNISNDFDELTTSKTMGPARATWLYASPEVTREEPRGRAADLWSLGCVMLEICAVWSGEKLSLRSLRDHIRDGRNTTAQPPYCDAQFKLWDWMLLNLRSQPRDAEMTGFIFKILQLSFLMLDPDPVKRINSQQLVDMLIDPRYEDFHDVGDFACSTCASTAGTPRLDQPLHSMFKKLNNGQTPIPLKFGLSAGMDACDIWEELKRRWLQEHIWWTDDNFF